MKSLDYYSKRIHRVADRAFTDKRESLPGVSKSIYDIVRPDGNTLRRAYGFFSLLRKSLPEQVWEKFGVSGTFTDFSHFPFDPEKYELKQRVGSGMQCDCFLFEPKDKSIHETWVLKVFQNAGNNLMEVENKGKQVNEDYKTLINWYQEMEGLIPVQSGLVIESFQSYNKRPVFVVLQKFLGLDVKDLVEDFSEDEWEKLCQKNPQIKEQLKQFIQITKNNIEKYGKVPDLLGHSNLAVTDSVNSPQLFFLDPDGIDKFSDMSIKVKSKVENRLGLLCKRAGID
jgi:hypothetical protein